MSASIGICKLGYASKHASYILYTPSRATVSLCRAKDSQSINSGPCASTGMLMCCFGIQRGSIQLGLRMNCQSSNQRCGGHHLVVVAANKCCFVLEAINKAAIAKNGYEWCVLAQKLPDCPSSELLMKKLGYGKNFRSLYVA